MKLRGRVYRGFGSTNTRCKKQVNYSLRESKPKLTWWGKMIESWYTIAGILLLALYMFLRQKGIMQ